MGSVSGLNGEREDLRSVLTATVIETPRYIERVYPGEIRVKHRVNLGFNVSGVLTELNAREGFEVKAGTLIAKLDPRDFQYQFDMARAAYLQNKLEFERQKGLFEDKVISQSDLDRVEVGYISAKAQFNIAKKALEDTELRVPFDGVIAKRYVENFSQILPKQDIVAIHDVGVLEVVAGLPENVIVKGTREDIISCTIQFDSLPDLEVEAKLSEFSVSPNPVTKTFTVVFEFVPPEGYNLFTGMSVSLHLKARLPESQGGFLVPSESVFTVNGEKSFVWVIPKDGGNPIKREIVVGKPIGENIQVTKGLGARELVATAGIFSLRENTAVRPVASNIMGLIQ